MYIFNSADDSYVIESGKSNAREKNCITLQEQVCTLFLITSKQTEQLCITKTKGTNTIRKENKQ